ncbi:small G protein rab11 [Chondrus crispus]|uniref:Small G protein rab11 n=1 Tax=Chondrus crispus TaxID=2769 RepID=S0F316_CHOCR|nr:small G protein rab11 [Chondrus crispus]CDF77581.1 small G protein rab11 [Chondrus crispus]|eukprot:XP_005718082.1 small G protein rab11 [Chondrus crispus]
MMGGHLHFHCHCALRQDVTQTSTKYRVRQPKQDAGYPTWPQMPYPACHPRPRERMYQRSQSTQLRKPRLHNLRTQANAFDTPVYGGGGGYSKSGVKCFCTWGEGCARFSSETRLHNAQIQTL